MTFLKLPSGERVQTLAQRLRQTEFYTSSDIVTGDYVPNANLLGTLTGTVTPLWGTYEWNKITKFVFVAGQITAVVTGGTSAGDFLIVDLPVNWDQVYDMPATVRFLFSGSYETGNGRLDATTSRLVLARDSAFGISATTYTATFSLKYKAVSP